ncbi:endonuclease III [bacterium]|nr:endonuclease III [bacterium]
MPRETKSALKARALTILERLEAAYPEATTALNWTTPWELLAATILSAQCTDDKVNEVTADLFRAYPTPTHYAEADLEALEQLVRPTGFYRNKAKSLVGAARAILENYGGEVPASMDQMLTLPGVARKTANVVLSHALRPDSPEGIAVDRHVARVTARLGLVPASANTPEKIEQVLMALIPRDHWTHFGDAVIWHGRRVCEARKPACDTCTLREVCPRKGLD